MSTHPYISFTYIQSSPHPAILHREELLGRPRGGKDVDWAAVTKTSVARPTTLPPPIPVDPMEVIRDYQATLKQQQISSRIDIVDIIPDLPSE